MGLTIHYKLRWTPPGPPPHDNRVRRFVEEARQQIIRARLGRVSRVIPAFDEYWTSRHIVLSREQTGEGSWSEHVMDLRPKGGSVFTLDVGEDCEAAVLGLCLYPDRVWHQGRFRHTHEPGWRLSSFSKTQYASLHGWEHFRRCHLAVIAALGIWRKLGARVKISDEGEYWPHRSERKLRRELDLMNGAIAGIAGALKDVGDELDGPPVQSPIFAHPQFERLEANGVRRHGAKIAALTKALAR